MELKINGIYTSGDTIFMVMNYNKQDIIIMELNCDDRNNRDIAKYVDDLYIFKLWHDHVRAIPISHSLIKNIDLRSDESSKKWYIFNN